MAAIIMAVIAAVLQTALTKVTSNSPSATAKPADPQFVPTSAAASLCAATAAKLLATTAEAAQLVTATPQSPVSVSKLQHEFKPTDVLCMYSLAKEPFRRFQHTESLHGIQAAKPQLETFQAAEP